MWIALALEPVDRRGADSDFSGAGGLISWVDGIREIVMEKWRSHHGVADRARP